MPHVARVLAGAVLLASALLPAAASGRAAEPVIALDGTPPHAIARFAGGRWTKAAESLPCEPAGRGARVVASGGASAAPVTRLMPASDEWNALRPAIRAVFEERESEHLRSAKSLGRVPIQVDAVYAAGAGTYYFEASRRVPDPGTAPEEDPKGTFRLTVSGWLSRTADNIATLGSKSQVGWDQDRPDGTAVRRPDLVPLAVVGHESSSIWVMRGGVGDIAWISLYAVGERGVRTLIDQVRCLK